MKFYLLKSWKSKLWFVFILFGWKCCIHMNTFDSIFYKLHKYILSIRTIVFIFFKYSSIEHFHPIHMATVSLQMWIIWRFCFKIQMIFAFKCAIWNGCDHHANYFQIIHLCPYKTACIYKIISKNKSNGI